MMKSQPQHQPLRVEIIYQKKSYEVDITNQSDTIHDAVMDIYQNIIRPEMNLFSRTYADLMISRKMYRLTDASGSVVSQNIRPGDHAHAHRFVLSI